MDILNLNATINLFSPDAIGDTLNFLGVVVQWIVTWLPWVGVGIILFTLILKTITLPLDIFSKASMRKNSLKMEKMRPQLEKLQKQYQNDQQTYNAKMMELYKKNGYSMLGACLPSLVTIVIFFIVMGAFSDYSQFANLDVYREMTRQYNAAVLQYAPEIESANLAGVRYEEGQSSDAGVIPYTRIETYTSEDSLIEIVVKKSLELDEAGLTAEELDGYDWSNTDAEQGPVVKAESTEYNVKAEETLASGDAAVQAAVEKARANAGISGDANVAAEAMRIIGRAAAAEAYEEFDAGFLWVKNIWLPDTSYQHPLQQEQGIDADHYNEITYDLTAEKDAANGYYILIVISIGTMFLSQFIISRSQKAQNELQTADGRGKKTQNMMMVIMPLMFGVFSFFYSAAFSIYMIVSNLYSIVSTLLINLVIDARFKKKEELEIQAKYNQRIPQSARKTGNERKGGKTK